MIAGMIIGFGIGTTAATVMWSIILVKGTKRRKELDAIVLELLQRKAEGIERIAAILERNSADALLGVSFSSVLTGDAFLTFRASNGEIATINMHAFADRSGPIAKSAIRCWIKDNTPDSAICVHKSNAEAARTAKAGERMGS